MKTALFILINSFCVLWCYCRLVEKNTDKPKTSPGIKLENFSPVIRSAREAFKEEPWTGYSEENIQSDEIVRPYDTKRKTVTKTKFIARAQLMKRNTGVVNNKTSNLTHTSNVAPKTSAVVLVKKPIPKFNEIDYDDDFQIKVERSAAIITDSNEHEDEDFNVDDYDFDVNHDEYAGRGKPLEPRLKIKETKNFIDEQNSEVEMKPKPTPPPVIKIQSKVIIPPVQRMVPVKRMVHKTFKKAENKMKDDYYDDITTTQVAPKETTTQDEDDFADDAEDKDKGTSIRIVRSPWNMTAYVDNLDKTSKIMSKVLGILPMFPQVPNKDVSNELS